MWPPCLYCKCILLLYRLDTLDVVPNPFDWSQDVNDMSQAHINEITPAHQSILHLIGYWMEEYPEDFKDNPVIKVTLIVNICTFY